MQDAIEPLATGDTLLSEQARQSVPPDEKVLAAQDVQVPGSVVFLYVPRAHAVQATEPVVVLNVPVAHSAHATPFAPVYPIIQIQLTRVLLPVPIVSVLLGHDRQLATSVDVAVVE